MLLWNLTEVGSREYGTTSLQELRFIVNRRVEKSLSAHWPADKFEVGDENDSGNRVFTTQIVIEVSLKAMIPISGRIII